MKLQSEEKQVYEKLQKLGPEQLVEDIAEACNLQVHLTSLRLNRLIRKGKVVKNEEFTPYGLLKTYTINEY